MKNRTTNNKFSAFTLAEVLITLGIIGVVAALTIPTLMNNYQKGQTLSQYKKVYSEISQAIKLAEVQYGESEGWDWIGSTLPGTQLFVDNYFYPFIKTLKKCPNGNSDCWKAAVSLSNTSGYLNPTVDTISVSAISASGYSMYIWAGGSPYMNHARIWVDLDGPTKGQSKLGKDIFGFVIVLGTDATNKKGIYPAGLEAIPPPTRTSLTTDVNRGCSKDTTGTIAGFYCGALIVSDGWTIADDYPW